MASATRKRSTVNENMLEADGATPITGLPPGEGQPLGDVTIETLGKLSSFPDLTQVDNPAEGTGEWIVVLSDFLTGTGETESFARGAVRRLSRVVVGLDDESVDRNLVKGRLKRLFTLRAIRMATNEEVAYAEQNAGKIDIVEANETEAVQNERAKRLELEKENEQLRQALMNAGVAREEATPSTAGASSAAQAATAEKEGTEEEKSDWE